MGAIYFCFVITIGAFVFVNLVVAVVVTNLVRTSPNTWAGRGGGGVGGAPKLRARGEPGAPLNWPQKKNQHVKLLLVAARRHNIVVFRTQQQWENVNDIIAD